MIIGVRAAWQQMGTADQAASTDLRRRLALPGRLLGLAGLAGGLA